jgi:hypothetical protein
MILRRSTEIADALAEPKKWVEIYCASFSLIRWAAGIECLSGGQRWRDSMKTSPSNGERAKPPTDAGSAITWPGAVNATI